FQSSIMLGIGGVLAAALRRRKK
ncbi:MAG: PEP-CTERM sorting domain-containing protein, partial [Betaproteobacteria bacterium]|nr:PEP-CTERM sorting domain-containing protein [Betaproteobacteria bacterium]